LIFLSVLLDFYRRLAYNIDVGGADYE